MEPNDKDAFDDTLNSEELVHSYWKKSHSLLLFRGTIFSNDGTNFFAKSRPYFGDLRGEYPHPSAVVQLPIEAEQIGMTNDTHSLIVLYVLAMDAIRTHDKPDQIIALLTKARDKINDLKRPGRLPLPPDIIKLEESISHALEEQKKLGSK